ncbi:MAG: methyl-accepting chemotaxis protein [Gammaproteobacteria bacterium]|jgi:methyl-accepting chemotaxis protein
MTKLSLKHKIWLGYLALLAIALVNAGASVSNLYRSQNTVTSLIEESQPLVLMLHEFNGFLGKSTTSLATFLFTRNDQQRIDYQNASYQAGESLLLLREFGQNSSDSQLNQSIAQIVAEFAQYQLYEGNLFSDKSWEHRDVALNILDTDLMPSLGKLQVLVDDMVLSQSEIMESKSKNLLTEAAASIALQSVMALVGVGLFGIIALLISRQVCNPLNEMVDALQDVAAGEGDLTRLLKVKSGDEIGQLAAAFNQFSDKVRSVVLEVSDCARELTVSAQQMDQVATNTNSDIKNQSHQIDQVFASIEDMSSQVKSVVDSTVQAAELAEQTSETAATGKSVVDQSLSSSSQLSQDVGNAVVVISRLVNDVDSIGGVVGVIRGIAEQTNLLALNAAIEAARAGEQGRGFAVVADEVRNLASKTQESTEEIHAMIERLQEESGQAVEVMNNGQQQALQSLEHATLAGDALVKINQTVQGMLEMNRQIAISTDAQGSTAAQVNSNMLSIKDLSAHTSNSANSITDMSQQVNSLSKKLEQILGQFKV